MELDPREIDGALTWTLTRAARHIQRRMTAVIASQGLSAVQFGVLTQLAANGPMTRAQLARATLTSPQSMSGVIEGMVERGLLELAGSGGRGRRNPVALTAEGHRIIEAAWPAHSAASEAARLGLSESEAAQLNTTLHKLLAL